MNNNVRAPFFFDEPAPVVVLPVTFEEKHKFWAENSLKVAELLKYYKNRESEFEVQLDQQIWAISTECGTAACALGLAAMYRAVPGLSSNLPFVKKHASLFKDGSEVGWSAIPQPLVNNEDCSWKEAGITMFGSYIFSQVFRDGGLGISGLINRLSWPLYVKECRYTLEKISEYEFDERLYSFVSVDGSCIRLTDCEHPYENLFFGTLGNPTLRHAYAIIERIDGSLKAGDTFDVS